MNHPERAGRLVRAGRHAPSALLTGMLSAAVACAAAPPPPAPVKACAHAPVHATCDRDGWCEIPAGCFVAGSPEAEWGRGLYSEDRALVTLTRPFAIQRHEVTRAQWRAAGLDDPSGRSEDGSGDCADPSCPVGNVTWFDAAAYANLLSSAHSPPLSPCYRLDQCTGAPGRGLRCAEVSSAAGAIYAALVALYRSAR